MQTRYMHLHMITKRKRYNGKTWNQWYREALFSPDYYRWKQAVLRAAGFRCSLCNKPGNKRTLSPHHRTYEQWWEWRPEDGTALCHACHQRTHGIVSWDFGVQQELPLEAANDPTLDDEAA